MQLPVLRDGVVVNVVEIGEDTIIGTKAELRAQVAAESAAHALELAAWREAVTLARAEVEAAEGRLAAARKDADAARERIRKARAAGKKAASDADAVLAIDDEVAAHEMAVASLKAKPLPPRPVITRAKRWAYPEGCEVGAPGGNIGERWDGKRYIAAGGNSEHGEGGPSSQGGGRG